MLSTSALLLALTVLAVFYGIAWTVMNVYNYYPVVRAAAERVVTGTPTADAAFVDTDRIELTEDGTYPDIDVFVPGYMEQDVIHQSIKSIRETDYPHEHLTLTVLLEPDDSETIARVKELQEYIDLDLLVVPESYPGTSNKPRALNYGFEQTDGDIVGIVDAENVVSSNLFDRVAKAIVGDGNDYVQGIVDMVNEEDGWKNLLFRAEYGYWYRFILPAFKRLGFPIPLSGTTCFFRRDVLESVSDQRRDRKGDPWESGDKSALFELGLSGITPWDPKNVTEDFELGLQLWASDHSFGIIDSVTKEESPQTLENWMKQRTRWQKGKVFTFLDFFKHRAGTSMGQRAHLLWQSFLPHAGPLNVTGLFLLIGVGSALGFVPPNAFVSGILQFGFIFFFVGLLSFGAGYWLTSKKSPGTKLFRTAIITVTVPAYWILQWAADIRAFKQLAVGDLGWEKTVHQNSGRLESLQEGPTEPDSLGSIVRAKLRTHILLLPILLLALVLRIPNIGRPYWIDEIYSVTQRGAMNTYGILTAASDPHPPLYYLVTKGWITVFGRGEIAVRSLSLLFGLASIVAVYLLATELYNQRTGRITALLFAISSFQIQYAQTARMYTMFVCLAALSMYFYVRTLKSHSSDNRIGYAVTTLLMLLTQVYAVFVVLAQLLHLSFKLFRWSDVERIKKWSVTQVMAFGFFTPWFGLIAVPNYLLADESTEVRWLSKPGLDMLSDIAMAYAGVPMNYPTVNITGVTLILGRLFAAVIVLSVLWQLYKTWNSDTEVEGTKLLGALLVCFTLIPFAISVTIIPLLEVRYTIVGFIAAAILLAKSIADIDYDVARITAVSVVVLLFAVMLQPAYAAETAEDWDHVSDVIEGDLDESSLIVYNPGFTKDALEYYLSENATAKSDRTRFTTEEALTTQIDENGYEQIWVVNIHKQNYGAVGDALPANYTSDRTESLGAIHLIEFERNASQAPDQTAEVDA